MPKCLAIIPARAGSKRLPGKNMVSLGCKPLVAWTFDAAKKSGVFSRIVVSTDSDAIAGLAVKNQLELSVRPERWAKGEPWMLALWIRHLLTKAEWHGAVMFLQPTSPFREAWHVRSAWAAYLTAKSDSLVSVDPWDKVNGAIYIFDSARDLRRRGLYDHGSRRFEMNARASIDIDTPEDLEKADRAAREWECL